MTIALLSAEHQVVYEKDGGPGSEQLADDAKEAFQCGLEILCHEEYEGRDDGDDDRLEYENQGLIPDEMSGLQDEFRGLESEKALRCQAADGCDVIDDG